jgi:hypothetical protein
MEMKRNADVVNERLRELTLQINCERFIQEYLQAVAEIKADDSPSLEEKLTKITTPLLSLLSQYYNAPFDRYVRVVDEDYIDLKNEIDAKNLNYDDEKYDIQNPINTGDRWLLETETPTISLSDKFTDYLTYCRDVAPITEADFDNIYEGIHERTIVEVEDKWKNVPPALIVPFSRLTLNEVHELWLPSLTQESIKKRDLLQQVLVCYTIKKAQNGDEKSALKLFELFENKVRFDRTVKNDSIAINIHTVRIIKRLLNSGLDVDFSDDASYDQDIILTARNYLWLIVRGFNPRTIIGSILQQNDMYPVPRRVKEFYLRYFSEEVPDRLHETLIRLSEQEKVLLHCKDKIHQMESCFSNESDMAQTIKELKKNLEWAIFNSKLTVDVLLNPYHPITEGYWTDKEGKPHLFNSYCYRPNKKGNLTLWLFGPKGKPEYGKLYQLVKDEYATEIGRYNATISADAPEPSQKPNKPYSGDESKEALIERIESKQGGKEAIESLQRKELLDKGFKELTRTGFSKRDIEIFRARKLLEKSASEIEQKFGVGTRQQEKICKKIEEALRRSINNLR